MDIDLNILDEIVNRPAESLSTEIKRWIDPIKPEGIAKIVKACIAMKNNNGGFLLIGFDNDSLNPLSYPFEKDVHEVFHQDVIQGIVSKYSSSPFEIAVEFRDRNGQLYPIICVEGGIRTPIASKNELRDGDKKVLLKEHCVYIRTLNSNNTVSTSEARYQDWDRIVSICFDNREADIGRFIRRNLVGLEPSYLVEIAQTIIGNKTDVTKSSINYSETALEILNKGLNRYDLAKTRYESIPKHGA